MNIQYPISNMDNYYYFKSKLCEFFKEAIENKREGTSIPRINLLYILNEIKANSCIDYNNRAYIEGVLIYIKNVINNALLSKEIYSVSKPYVDTCRPNNSIIQTCDIISNELGRFKDTNIPVNYLYDMSNGFWDLINTTNISNVNSEYKQQMMLNKVKNMLGSLNTSQEDLVPQL